MSSAPAAALVYVTLSLALTWPLPLGLTRDVPADLGDSLLNMWILAWGAEHVPRVITGTMSWGEFWNANIFHPEPFSFALSEHLVGPALQILPLYWLTGNIILCYNLLFVSTFALSAFGAYLLVRDLTGDARAAFIAGLIYGFLPYRIASLPHLQVLSSQWMPFALYGLNRFITSGSVAALAGGTAALVMQNWSCGYYLLYFAPFVPLFVLHRLWTQGALRNARAWLWLGAAAAATVLLTVPFLLPYQRAQILFGSERPLSEVVGFSASIWSYITASENVRLWGGMLRFHDRPEGETFLGFVPWLLAAAAVAAALARTTAGPGSPARFRWVTIILFAAAASQFVALMLALMFGGFDAQVLGLRIRATTPQRLLFQFVATAGLLLAFSARMRARASRLARSPVTLAAVAAILAMWLSFGPLPSAGDGNVSGVGIYRGLYDYVPGFNGLRVPARYAMITGLFLAILAGYGATLLTRHSPLVTTALSAAILLESVAVPIEINRTWNMQEATPPPRVFPASRAPAVYGRVAALPEGSVISEFPYGDGAWEIRYVYYSAAHWKPITNGYSGGFPPRYTARVARLQRVAADPGAAWQSLRDAGTTHVVLHRNAFARSDDADTIDAWLRSHGAVELGRFPDGDMLFGLSHP